MRLSCPTAGDLPDEYTFTRADAGSHHFHPSFPADTVSRVSVAAGQMEARSNPIVPRRGDERAVYFGDIHSHSRLSADAVGDPDNAYEYAQNFRGLDFAALSDHAPRGGKWETAVETANRHDAPGRFVTLLGFEWSDPNRGHRNIYYRADDAPPRPSGVGNNMEGWWNYLDGRDIRALTVPHHPNTQSTAVRPDGSPVWGPADWSTINHTYQRLVEICQNRGSFEVPGGPVPELRVERKDRGASVQTALVKGHRLGFIASTDTHTGRPGTGVGRVAAVTDEFSRTGIWDALHARSCYATTGARILVFFRVNDRRMGSVIDDAALDAGRHVEWRVVGTDRLKRVDLLRNNQVLKSWDGDGTLDMSDTFEREKPLQQRGWWYLRALQDDEEIAWSSPVWVRPR